MMRRMRVERERMYGLKETQGEDESMEGGVEGRIADPDALFNEGIGVAYNR
jgi:hypothetical protein